MDPDRAGVYVAHLQRDRPTEPGIDPAAGLVERDAKACDTRFALDSSDNVIRQFYAFQCFGEDELSRVQDKRVSMRLFDVTCHADLIVRVDDFVAGPVPDKVAAKPDVHRVRLNEFFIVGIDLDMAPRNAIEELPVHENHWH